MGSIDTTPMAVAMDILIIGAGMSSTALMDILLKVPLSKIMDLSHNVASLHRNLRSVDSLISAPEM